MKRFLVGLSGVYLILCGLFIAASIALLFFLKSAYPQASAQGYGLNFILLFGLPMVIWLIVTGIGICFRKNWARYSLFVLSGLSIFMTLPSIIFIPLTWLLFPGLMHKDALFFLIIMLCVQAVIGIVIPVLLLVLFTRKGVKEMFIAPGTERKISPVPLGVKIIAVLAIIGAFSTVLTVFLPMAFNIKILGDIYLKGIYLKGYMVAVAALNLLIAAGLFRLKRWAWWTYVIFTVVSIIIGTMNSLMIDEASLKRMMPENFPAETPMLPILFYKVIGLMSLTIPAIFLSYMFYKRDIFLKKERLGA